MGAYDPIVTMDLNKYNDERDGLIGKLNSLDSEIKRIDKDIVKTFNQKDEIDALKCDEVLANLDAIAFINIEVPDYKDAGNLFGNISDVIESAINKEVNEISLGQNLGKHATPDMTPQTKN
jgi:hypothetical protein